ncbi:MAG: DnaD domain protein [Oscillospiraceae bacterium]|nr:DnaD domain protein [Oscillospiraceae bacterium]
MDTLGLQIPHSDLNKLLCAKNPDAALLYLYIHGGGDAARGEEALNLSKTRYACAAANLRQMGLWPETRTVAVFSGERPQYTEQDVVGAMGTDRSFQALYGEVQRALGRTLNTEELKILLGFVRYLGLPNDVISMLVYYCKDRARAKGQLRNPSLRAIEKEAYYWAENGIDTMEEAAAYMQNQNLRRSRLAGLKELLQIRGRTLTPGETRYAESWLEMGFEDAALKLAYEKTCLNTGGLSWAYMNKILTRWQESGLFTLEQVMTGDKKPAKSVPRGAAGRPGQAELDAIAKLLKED